MKRAKFVALIVVVVLGLALRIAGGSEAMAGYVLLAVYALCGRAQAIEALSLTWLCSVLNPGIAADATGGMAVRYLVVASAALSVLLRSVFDAKTLTSRAPIQATLGFGSFVVVHSLVISPLPQISILKGISWTVIMSTLLAAWGGLTAEERDALISRIFGGLVLLMLASLPLLAMPLGYLRNEQGFQGVLSHPQVFGLTMALLGAWASSRLLADEQPKWFQVTLLGGCLMLVILSEARTAGLGLALALIVSIVTVASLSKRSFRAALPGVRSTRVLVMMLMAVGVAPIAGPFIADRVGAFISKRGEAQTLRGAFEESRGHFIDQMGENIREHPLLGIGFGIASFPEDFVVERDTLLGLPVSATTEKGVLPVMVVEELGALGALAFVLWLWIILRKSATRGGLVALAVIWTALLLNIGEAMLFSPGGMGLLLMILIAWGVNSGSGQDEFRSRSMCADAGISPLPAVATPHRATRDLQNPVHGESG